MKASTRLYIYHLLRTQLQRLGVDLQRYPPPQVSWPELVLDGIMASRSATSTDLSTPFTLEYLENFLAYCLEHRIESNSQLFQDLFVRWLFQDKHNGFFVEFGATNGIHLSNTFFLETQQSWRGILAEPARSWHADLMSNRSCLIDTRCVWSVSGEQLPFHEVVDPALSTIATYADSDRHAARRQSNTTYSVHTVSLNHLLSEHHAPSAIDYLSIDTEGTEFDILSAFDFSTHSVGVITVEHNYTPLRQQIYNLLTSKGFVRCFVSLSKWDDWYVNTQWPSLATNLIK